MVDMNTDQFRTVARARHAAGQTFSADEVEAMPPTHYAAMLDDAATVQRGAPEAAMLHAQRALGGGLYSHTLEHVGDLTHRMAEGGAAYGSEFVAPKVRQQLHGLTHPYGFEREMHEQVESNRRFKEQRGEHGATEEERQQLGQKYSEAHRSVPVYTKAMYHGREAAVAVGEDRFTSAVLHLSALQRMIDAGEPAWREGMSQPASVRFLRGER